MSIFLMKERERDTDQKKNVPIFSLFKLFGLQRKVVVVSSYHFFQNWLISYLILYMIVENNSQTSPVSLRLVARVDASSPQGVPSSS